ncbi:hypothetical protein [Amnibacterium kyonggiense]|uniref:Uncharacterized protein n=1 Tax=Amnibacterium kyonggiense TaxID=595671 RepID=A0A4R7FSN7_9MICO|nr:hypothetical protein [Amnibacterium kyonggiense]TDS80850.1 hypothetical protein CLV52_1420 [Amnibacterium kyonggiense]
MSSSELSLNGVTIDRLGFAGYRPRAADDGLLVTDGELRWRISKDEHAFAVDFAERGDAWSRRIEARRFEDVERWLMLTTSPDVRMARGQYAPAGPSEEEMAPGFSIRLEGRDRLVVDRGGQERIRLVNVGDRVGAAVAFTHLADLPLAEVPARLDRETPR